MSDCGCDIEIKDQEQSRVLWTLLAINGVMFVIELSIGWYAQSTGLIADSLDMLADATVYGIGLYAVGQSLAHKARAALFSGWAQGLLALLILVDIIRRAIYGSEPVSTLMMGMGVVALAANVWCLVLIQKHREGEVHMRASWVFSKNDVIANTGIILSGLLVWLLDSRWPDLIIGSLIVVIILRGARHIILDAQQELAADPGRCSSTGEDSDVSSSS
ncbi:cation transporter [Thiolapillus brandeum]|uniref:Cation diffusion facilitator n=1 Tax=Thiolapillus brandeum TaxID=1076588 RepID=A0A7U6GIT1_9GAMM|nr:cation transporter [Thiolapillus brandeum]BAO44385.1 cation diffusion facilitator [Thiolapillus brandeum]